MRPANCCLRQPLVGRVRDLRRPSDRVQLLRLLVHSKGLDEAPPRHEVDTALTQKLPVRVGERVSLEPNALGKQLGEVRVDVALRLLELDALDGAGALRIAEVGEEPRAFRLDENCGVRALETGEVAHVHRRRDEQRLLEEPAQPF